MPRTMNPETNPTLLKRPTYVSFDNDELLSKLWDSAAIGDNDAVKLILKLFPDLEHDNYTKSGYSPFLIAVTNNHVECVRTFFEQDKISLDRQYGNTLNTAAHVAVFMKHKEMIALLRNAGARFDIENADKETVNSLLALQCSTSKEKTSSDHKAATATTAVRAHTPMYREHCRKSVATNKSSKEEKLTQSNPRQGRQKLISSC